MDYASILNRITKQYQEVQRIQVSIDTLVAEKADLKEQLDNAKILLDQYITEVNNPQLPFNKQEEHET